MDAPVSVRKRGELLMKCVHHAQISVPYTVESPIPVEKKTILIIYTLYKTNRLGAIYRHEPRLDRKLAMQSGMPGMLASRSNTGTGAVPLLCLD